MTSHQPLAVIDPQGANAGLYRSEDQGDSWQQLKGGLLEVMTAAPRAAASHPEDADVFYMGTFPGRAWHAAPGQIPAGTLWRTEANPFARSSTAYLQLTAYSSYTARPLRGIVITVTFVLAPNMLALEQRVNNV